MSKATNLEWREWGQDGAILNYRVDIEFEKIKVFNERTFCIPEANLKRSVLLDISSFLEYSKRNNGGDFNDFHFKWGSAMRT